MEEIKLTYYERNKEKVLQYRKEYQKNNKEKEAQREKEWRANNKEKIVQRGKKYRANNKDKIVQGKKEYRENNKDKCHYLSTVTRQRKKQVNEYFPKNMRTIIYNKFNHQCFNCSSTENLHIDHHYPLSKGFALTITNAVLLCRRCNSSKWAKLPEEFYTKKQLNDLELNYGISKSPFQEKQPSIFKYLK